MYFQIRNTHSVVNVGFFQIECRKGGDNFNFLYSAVSFNSLNF